jgi:hypothetical protein
MCSFTHSLIETEAAEISNRILQLQCRPELSDDREKITIIITIVVITSSSSSSSSNMKAYVTVC